MKAITSCLLVVAMLGGCGIEGAIKRNDDRYMQPGAQDSPLTGRYKTFQYKFLDLYRITHQWVNSSGCEYRGVERPGSSAVVRSLFYDGRDIYESEGKTWLRFDAMLPNSKPFDFDRFVRSVKVMRPTYETVNGKSQRIGEAEKEEGFKALCGETWQVTNHSFTLYLHKRDLASWRAMLTERNPKGRWSERRVGANVWLAQETAEQDFKPKPLNGFGGPFQTWLLPIGDTGYILALELSANRESLKYLDAHTRFQTTFRYLIESVKIEPLQP